jgi:hypothetical protein
MVPPREKFRASQEQLKELLDDAFKRAFKNNLPVLGGQVWTWIECRDNIDVHTCGGFKAITPDELAKHDYYLTPHDGHPEDSSCFCTRVDVGIHLVDVVYHVYEHKIVKINPSLEQAKRP